jgi:class 3 adenylate cyclase
METASTKLDQDVFALLRRQFRGLIYQVISYAELVGEAAKADAGSELCICLDGIISQCESSLHLVSTYPSDTDHVPDSLLDGVKEQLVRQCRNVLALTQQVGKLIPVGSTAPDSKDAQKLESAARTLERQAGEISIDRLLELSHSYPAVQSQGSIPSVPSSSDTNITQPGIVLVVDDDGDNQTILSRRLLADGHEVLVADSGRQALRILRRCQCDLVLLDIMLPDIDGLTVLREIKESPEFRHLPVIMITADDSLETVVRCIEMGASDYLLKPFNSVLLRARVRALLEGKRLRDADKKREAELTKALAEIEQQRQATQKVLLNILPLRIAEELKNHGKVQPTYFEDVTIVFADIVGFTLSTEQLPADELVQHLHTLFSAFDEIMLRYGLEKLKIIGDCYMFAGGLPVRCPSHPVDSVLAALEMLDTAKSLGTNAGANWDLRIGMHTGPVIAGVVGIHKFAFDIWGETVNLSSRLETLGTAGRVNVSNSTYSRVKDFFRCDKREPIRTKEGREVDCYLVNGLSASLLKRPAGHVAEAFKARYRTYFCRDLTVTPTCLREDVVPIRTAAA